MITNEIVLFVISKAAIGSCSYENVFLTISDHGNQSCSEYILILFLLGNRPVPMKTRIFCWESNLFFTKYSAVVTAGKILLLSLIWNRKELGFKILRKQGVPSISFTEIFRFDT